MTHSICTSDADRMLTHFQRLGRTLFAPNIETRTRLELLFEHETTEFGLNCAFLSHIDRENETYRFDIVHGSQEFVVSGRTVPLSNTYCRRTIEDPEGTLAISDAPAEGWKDDPAYETFELRSYLGTTVSVGDELYGTLCFADTAARDEPLVDMEKALLEIYSQWVGYIITLGVERPTQETRIDTIQGRAVSSDAIDSMMDALASRARRIVLMTLLEDTAETSIATLERQIDHENARVHLYHTHLPKLANSGYITWDDEADTITKGQKFSEMEPLVRLLKEYEEAFPA